MSKKLKKLATVVAPHNSIDQVVSRMAEESRQVVYPGLAVVLDEDDILLGIMTDGDIRRTYSRNIDFSQPVSEVMTRNPVTIPATILENDVASEVIKCVQLDGRHQSEWVRHVLIVDERGRLVKIVDLHREVFHFLMLGSSTCVLLSFLEGRKSDAILRCDLGPTGARRSQRKFRRAQERDKKGEVNLSLGY